MRGLVAALGVVFAGCSLLDPFPELSPDEPQLLAPIDAASTDGAPDGSEPVDEAGSRPPATPSQCDSGTCGRTACDGGSCLDAAVASPPFQWAVDVTSSKTFDRGPAIATRANGDMLLAFSGFGSWQSGASSLPDTQTGDVGLVFVNASGSVTSSKRIDLGGAEQVVSAAFDAAGDVWLAGYASALGGATNDHALVRKVSPSGVTLLSAAIDVSDSTSLLHCVDISVGSGGHIALACTGKGTGHYTKVDGTVASFTMQGTSDGIVARINATNGRIEWLERIGAEGFDLATSVAVDAQGNVYVTGSFDSASIPFPSLVRLGARSNAFVAKLNVADGSVAWAKQYGDVVDPPIYGPGETAASAASGLGGQGIAVDAAGHLAVGGRYRGTVDFGGDQRSGDLPGFFVLLLDAASGARTWSKYGRGTTSRGGFMVDLAFDGAGYVAAVGSALGGGTGKLDGHSFPIYGNISAFAAKMRLTDGDVAWVKSVHASSGPLYVEGTGVGFTPNGELVCGLQVSGTTSPTTVDLGDGKPITTTGLVGAVVWGP